MNKLTMPLLVAGCLAVGCLPEVVDEGRSQSGQNLNGNSGSAGNGGSTGNPSGGSTELKPAVAMTRAQLDALWDAYWDENGEPSGSSSSSGGGAGLDPNDLFVKISDQGASCSSPTVDLECGGHWSVSIAIPPDYQTVGLYDLEDPRIAAYSGMNETGDLYSPDPNDCAWGGGSLGPGTIEIVSISNDEVQLVLTMDESFWDSDPSGLYTASICAD